MIDKVSTQIPIGMPPEAKQAIVQLVSSLTLKLLSPLVSSLTLSSCWVQLVSNLALSSCWVHWSQASLCCYLLLGLPWRLWLTPHSQRPQTSGAMVCACGRSMLWARSRGRDPDHGQAGSGRQAGSPREMPCRRVPGSDGVLGRKACGPPLLHQPAQGNETGKCEKGVGVMCREVYVLLMYVVSEQARHYQGCTNSRFAIRNGRM